MFLSLTGHVAEVKNEENGKQDKVKQDKKEAAK